MKTYTQEELAVIIEKHGKWLNDEEGGEHANLSYANLSRANLSYANLTGANLSYANLSEIRSLWGASGNCSDIKAIQCDTWPVTYTATHMQIGCQFHTLKEWWKFSDEEISLMDSQALAWWKVWKPILSKIIKASPAEPTGYVDSKE